MITTATSSPYYPAHKKQASKVVGNNISPNVSQNGDVQHSTLTSPNGYNYQFYRAPTDKSSGGSSSSTTSTCSYAVPTRVLPTIHQNGERFDKQGVVEFSGQPRRCIQPDESRKYLITPVGNHQIMKRNSFMEGKSCGNQISANGGHLSDVVKNPWDASMTDVSSTTISKEIGLSKGVNSLSLQEDKRVEQCQCTEHHSNALDSSQSFVLKSDQRLERNVTLVENRKSIQERLGEIASSHEVKTNYRRFYELGNFVRSGGFSDIYEGRCLRNNCKVILKFIPKHKTKNWLVVCGTKYPAEALLHKAVCDLPGVLDMYEYFEEEECWVIVIQRIAKCCDLFDYMERMRHGRLSEATARYFFRQLICTNIDLTRRGVVHRDIKSENILYDFETDKLVLIDFGASAILQDNAYTDFHGTRQFRPPEYVKWARYRAISSTVWTLGVLLYDMVMGKLPFEDDADIVSNKVTITQPISMQMHSLLLRCLNQNPELRPSLKELLQDPWVSYEAVPNLTSLSRNSINTDIGSTSNKLLGQACDSAQKLTKNQQCQAQGGVLMNGNRA